MANIEYEAKFTNIDKNNIRGKLSQLGAQLIKPEFLQKRIAFYLPKGHEINGAWARVRDEQDKITMSIKIIDGTRIENQKEICLTVDSFEEAVKFLTTLGCSRKSYQENRRELWRVGDVEVMIDEWPFIEPFIEIEASSEEKVRGVAGQLGLDYAQAVFGATSIITQKKYGLSEEVINSTSEVSFNMENPYLI